MTTTLFVILSGLGIYSLHRLIEYRRALRSIQNFPGPRFLLSPRSTLGLLLPRIKNINQGRTWFLDQKHRIFEPSGVDACYIVGVFPESSPVLVLADASAIKEITHARARFPKPAHLYRGLSIYGRNIVASEGEEWKRHRKISAPAFSDRNNKLVWDVTSRVIDGLFNDVWKNQDIVDVENCLDFTTPIALYVISAAGFGKDISWKGDDVIPIGHGMTFKESLSLVSRNLLEKVLIPSWVMKFSKKLKKANQAFDELRAYMLEMIRERERMGKIERDDLFSTLLAANDGLTDEVLLNDSELTGNIFAFLVAGHETTAHTLAFTFGLLALYPDEQEKLFSHIKSVLKGREATYEDMPALSYVTAVYNETLRMFPPVVAIPKIAAEDTSLATTNAQGERIQIPVPMGTKMVLDTYGLHYNPRYWEDPYSFKPARFLGDWPRDAFLPFSAGPRACLGRKFFETEETVILTKIVSRYKISVKEEPQFAGESFEERRERVLKTKLGLTVRPVRVPLTFTKRV